MLTDKIRKTVEDVIAEYGTAQAKIAVQRLYNKDLIEEADAKDLIAQIALKSAKSIELI